MTSFLFDLFIVTRKEKLLEKGRFSDEDDSEDEKKYNKDLRTRFCNNECSRKLDCFTNEEKNLACRKMV